MNELDRAQLEVLKKRQAQLEQELALLGRQLRELDGRMAQTQAAAETQTSTQPAARAATRETAPVPIAAKITAPPAVPPILPKTSVSAQTTPPPPIPRAPQKEPAIPVAAKQQVSQPGSEGVFSERPLIPPVVTAPKPTPERSFEMRLGTFWLVRIGIVMLLTGLVFFGNYAYQNFVGKLGPGGKLALLYLASGILLGAGAWWQRKAVKESLRNYAQVLFAGGLASIYFTTYAAHHIDKLRVIESAGLDGILLIIWAGFMVWIADRKKSEVLALFAVLLAYYTSVITRAGLFTLYSNCVLTIAAVFFLVRNRWAALSFVSLSATYMAYGFWRFFNGAEWHWADPKMGLWTGTYFLIGYWCIFTAAVFLSRSEKLSNEKRAGFLTLNNGAFFALFLLTMLQVRHGGFWKFALIYGSALSGLAELARRVLRAEPLPKNCYLTQGLLLITIGFITKFSGLHLALVLACESAVLLFSGQMTRNRVMVFGAWISAALSVFWGMDGMQLREAHGLWLGVALGLLMTVNSLVAHYHLVSKQRASATPLRFRLEPAYFFVLALAVWLAATWNNTAHENFVVFLAVEAALLVFTIYLAKIPEITLLSLGYLGLAQFLWVMQIFSETRAVPWWNPLAMTATSLVVGHWWRAQKVFALNFANDSNSKAARLFPLLGKNLVLFAAGYFASIQVWGPVISVQPNPLGRDLPVLLGALIFGDSIYHHRQALPAGANRLQPTYSAALALLTWLGITWHCSSREAFPLVLAVEAALFTFSYYLLRFPELTLLGQFYLLIGQAFWVINFGLENQTMPHWWNPALLIAITLAVSHWWQKQKTFAARIETGLVCQGIFSLGIVALLYAWINQQVSAPAWLALSSVLAIGVTTYGVVTRAWLLAASGQLFMLASCIQFFWQLAESKPDWHFALAPLAALGVLSWSTMKWFQNRAYTGSRVRDPLLQIASIYRWAAIGMSIFWVCKYINQRERVWFFEALSLAMFILAGRRSSRAALLASGIYAAAALAFFWLPPWETIVYLPNLLVILLIMAEQQIAKRRPKLYEMDAGIHGAVMIIGSLSLWFLVSRLVIDLAAPGNDGGYLTASWSALALILFSLGIVVRERIYRWAGLGILACALGRVIVFDVWKLETLYRILSFMALGIVLLVLGFIYNKYQEKIKEWL